MTEDYTYDNIKLVKAWFSRENSTFCLFVISEVNMYLTFKVNLSLTQKVHSPSKTADPSWVEHTGTCLWTDWWLLLRPLCLLCVLHSGTLGLSPTSDLSLFWDCSAPRTVHWVSSVPHCLWDVCILYVAVYS